MVLYKCQYFFSLICSLFYLFFILLYTIPFLILFVFILQYPASNVRVMIIDTGIHYEVHFQTFELMPVLADKGYRYEIITC